MSRFSLYMRVVRLISAAAIAVAMMTLTVQGETSSLPTPVFTSTTIFLADPQLGVVGVCQGIGKTLYFEARTPEGSTVMSARLLDASGKTIAISGHSMDDLWLSNPASDLSSATASLSLAGALPGEIANALDNAVFLREITALSNLAVASTQGTFGATAMTIDSATASLPPLDAAAQAAASAYDAAAAAKLAVSRDSTGSLGVSFGGTRINTFVENFPDGENDDNPTGVLGRTEVSAQILSSDGTSLIQQIGGDDIPQGWDSDTTGMFRPPSLNPIDPIQTAIDTGAAIRVAALMTRLPSIATSDETGAIGNLVGLLRDEGMLPNIDFSGSAIDPSTCGNCFKTNIQIWNKYLVFPTQHSGTVVLHYNRNNPSNYPVLQYSTTFCNHGTCPHHKPMKKAGGSCPYIGSWMGHYRYAPHWQITAPPPHPPSGFHSCHKTPYHLYGGANWPGTHGHNCNDDSWTQIRAIKGETFDIDPSNDPNANGERCDRHGLGDAGSPGCDE